MEGAGYFKKVGEAAARGIVREKTGRIRDQLEDGTQAFKQEAAERVERVADQIRGLGQQFDRRDEAHLVARRLEKTADYLRYRSSGDIAADAWATTRQYRLLWLAGGLLAGVVAFRLVQTHRNRDRAGSAPDCTAGSA